MPLMDRIKTTDFPSLSEGEQLIQIRALQIARTNAVKLAKIKPKRKARKKKKTSKTSGRKRSVKSAEQKAQEALKKLTPEQIALLAKNL